VPINIFLTNWTAVPKRQRAMGEIKPIYSASVLHFVPGRPEIIPTRDK